jgi:hypothetical protein
LKTGAVTLPSVPVTVPVTVPSRPPSDDVVVGWVVLVVSGDVVEGAVPDVELDGGVSVVVVVAGGVVGAEPVVVGASDVAGAVVVVPAAPDVVDLPPV